MVTTMSTVPAIWTVVLAHGGQHKTAETNNGKAPMALEEIAEHKHREKIAHACALAIEGMQDLKQTLDEAKSFAKCNHDMMSNQYNMMTVCWCMQQKNMFYETCWIPHIWGNT